jgi:exodeoxyribonuclease-1
LKTISSILWHDYETFGAQPLVDRPAQFAALRTDASLQPMGDPVVLYCAPADDVLPHPGACLITGITPQVARERGVPEAEFAASVLAEMTPPGTCSAGYNSIRFDDVVTRNLLYRNLRDPYEREWKNGNSRWDLIDLMRMCYALRPQGIEWPMVERDPGVGLVPSFRLEDLTRANAIAHVGAHDALADVNATIALARLVRDKQPKLFEWALGMRDAKAAMKLLDPVEAQPVLHSSSRIPAVRGCTTLELPLAVLPGRPKSVVVFDLMADPTDLIEGAPEDIADRVFTPTADLPDGVLRLPLKLVHSNHVPMLAPAATLKDAEPSRIGLDPELCLRHASRIRAHLPAIRAKVIEVFSHDYDDESQGQGGSASGDPDLLLYSGGFLTDHDRFLLRKVLEVPPAKLPGHSWSFHDARLPLMVFRYRARNFPETLGLREVEAWEKDRCQRLFQPSDSRQLAYSDYLQLLTEYRQLHAGEPRAQRILDALQAWPEVAGIEALWQQWLAQQD